MSPPAPEGAPPARGVGILCALAAELGSLGAAVRRRESIHGLELLDLDPVALGLAGDGDLGPIRACVSGVGKVHATRAATLLVHGGCRRALLVVGTCGALQRGLVPGSLAHCTRAIQADLAVREGREQESDSELRSRWIESAPGDLALFLTADRPVLSAWRRWRLGAAFGGGVADMETAAAAAVAAAAGVPWAALRAVTDGAGWLGGASFHLHFPVQAGRAADSIPALLARLAARDPRDGADFPHPPPRP